MLREQQMTYLESIRGDGVRDSLEQYRSDAELEKDGKGPGPKGVNFDFDLFKRLESEGKDELASKYLRRGTINKDLARLVSTDQTQLQPQVQPSAATERRGSTKKRMPTDAFGLLDDEEEELELGSFRHLDPFLEIKDRFADDDDLPKRANESDVPVW